MRTVIVPDIECNSKVLFDPYRFFDLSATKIKLETSGDLCNFAFSLPPLPEQYAWEIVQDELYNLHLVAVRKDGAGLDNEL